MAKNAGVSEDLVRFFILNEGQAKTHTAKLEAYRRSGDVWTIGFGHTNLCREIDFKVKKGVTITLDYAFELLEGDIKEMQRLTERKMVARIGQEAYDNLPQSIKEMMIEYAFQNGPNGKLTSR